VCIAILSQLNTVTDQILIFQKSKPWLKQRVSFQDLTWWTTS
jgi:hypothetical protein